VLPMSGPKTFPASYDQDSSTPRFADRLSVGMEGALYCFFIAGIWAFLRMEIRNVESIIEKFTSVTPALIATGTLALLVGFSGSIVFGRRLQFPHNLVFPLLWNLLSILFVQLINTQTSATTSLPFQLRNIVAWADPVNFVPVLVLQILSLSALVWIRGRR
jgi:hypothetical protein